MRSDRLLSLLLLLQARNPRSARELATLLEVTPRTIYRDVDALSAAGVPVYVERGAGGGIALPDGYRQSLAHFSIDELHALFVASAQPLHDLGFAGPAAALSKIEGALSDGARRDAAKARERVLLDQNKWNRAEQPGAVLAAVRRALWDDRRLRMRYRDRVGTTSERVIEPLGLVAKAGVWYVVAREPKGELRTFRAERIVSVEELAERFVRPADFDLERHWFAATAALERPTETFDVTVRVRADETGPVSYWEARLVSDEGERKTYLVRFPGEDAALFQIVAWGARAEVLEPASLRAAAILRAKELLALYGG
ncbi:MAG TPA: WYL domain-containing protein [Candidatus Acidoferrum sp.]|nr:WYL domain-containing protein [Candidatus Acidoferrum sp.]